MNDWARPRARRARQLPSAVFLAIVAAFVLSGWLAWAELGFERLNIFVFVVVGWVVSLCLHEYSHALLAFRGGDRGVEARGYLDLNPMRYAHPVLSVVLPVAFLLFGGIGLPGGAVWVDHSALRDRRARSLVSVAGPAANLGCAVLLIVPFMAGVDTARHAPFWSGVAFLAFLQLTAFLLNLLPIPGVDGGNMIEPWLNAEWRRAFGQIAPYGMLVLFVLLMSPRINTAFFSGVTGLGSLLGLPEFLAGDGYALFRFWSS